MTTLMTQKSKDDKTKRQRPKMRKNIPIPTQISLLAEAITSSDPQAARLLVKRAFDVANPADLCNWGKKVDDATFDEIISLIREIQPQDSVEMILACQFVATHLRSMAKLVMNDATDVSHGMMLMRLSHQTLELLQKYRSKGSNINVNYFLKNEGQAIIQTSLGGTLAKKGE